MRVKSQTLISGLNLQRNKMIDIRFGNCHDIIKEMGDESVDMILTDPPYGISYQSSRRKVMLNLFIMMTIFLGLIRWHLSFIG